MCLTEEKGQSAASRQHVAVMLDEVVGFVRALNPLTIVDMTVGLGGHAEALLRATNAHLIGIDRDAAALAAAAANLAAFGFASDSAPSRFLRLRGRPRPMWNSLRRRDHRRPRHEQLRAQRCRPGIQFPPRRAARHAHGSGPAVARLRHRQRGDGRRTRAHPP